MSLNHLPLSRDTRIAFSAFAGKANNPGLMFDRYIAYWEDWTLVPKRRMDPPNPKLATLERIAHVPCDLRLLDALSKRQVQLFDTLKARTFEAHPEWRFVTGLGSHSPLEVGFTFHRLYGIPIVAGSSLKGLTRAYAKYGLHIPEDELKVVFGTQDKDARAGAAVFFDALPISKPQLELDVMNPHYPEWYQEMKPPANWQNPIPVFFLTVGKETWFRFAVAGRGKDGDQARDKAFAWLKDALMEMGAGAKTSAGYGYFSQSELVPTTAETPEHPFSADPSQTTPERRQGKSQQKGDRTAGLRQDQQKAAVDAKKQVEQALRDSEKRKQSAVAPQQTTYTNNATEPKAQAEQAADGSWLVILPKLPQQKYPLKTKTQFSKAEPGARIRVRVIVDKKGSVTRAEEL